VLLGRERPHELRERRLLAQGEGRARVRDRRLDLAAVPDDRLVREQAPDVAVAEAGDPLGIEPLECGAEPFALAQDREPGEPRLEPLETEPLVEAALVTDGAPPLLVVVGEVEGVGRLPAAVYAPATWTFTMPSSTTTGYVSTGSNAGSESGLPLARSNAEP
jgi:hypothetical protein